MDFTGKYIERTYQKVLHIHSGSIYDGTGSYVSPTFSGSVSVIGDVIVSSGSVYVDGEILGVSAETASYSLFAITSSYSETASFALNGGVTSYNELTDIPSDIVSGSSQVDYIELQNIPSGIVSGSSQIDHDQTTNYNVNEHFLQSSITEVGTVTSGDISAILPSGVVSGSSIESSSYVTDPFVAYINKDNYFTGSQYIIGDVNITGSVYITGSLYVDNIYEQTSGAGVTIGPVNINSASISSSVPIEIVSGVTLDQSSLLTGLVVNSGQGTENIYDFLVNTANYSALSVDSSNDSISIMSSSLGKLGFFGKSPTAQSTGWTITNHSESKAYDVDSTSISELSAVLGSLITELKNKGILGD